MRTLLALLCLGLALSSHAADPAAATGSPAPKKPLLKKNTLPSAAKAMPDPAPAPVVAPAPEATTPPVAIEPRPMPRYPTLSLRFREQGQVMLFFTVQENGSVTGLQVQRSSGHPRLDEAALKTAAITRFTPARDREGNAVPKRVAQPYVFKLPYEEGSPTLAPQPMPPTSPDDAQ